MNADEPSWADKSGAPEAMKRWGDKVAGSGWKAAPQPGKATPRNRYAVERVVVAKLF